MAQDLFERAVNATNAQIAVRDTSGCLVRGGISLSTGTPQATTILRGSANLGGSCGAFDFGASFREQFEAIPEIVTNIGESVVASIPMLARLLCLARGVRFGQALAAMDQYPHPSPLCLVPEFAECRDGGGPQSAGWRSGPLPQRLARLGHDAQRRPGPV